MPEDIEDILPQITESLIQERLTLAVMESCTGGLLSARIASTPGCGDYFLGGAVAYATDSKARFGVPEDIIRDYGVVSAETAAAMAQAVATSLGADVGIGVTGVAGPEPQDGQPVGRVYVAIATAGNARAALRFR